MFLVAVNVLFECMLRKASKNIQIPSGKHLIVLRVDCCHGPLSHYIRWSGKMCLPLFCIKIFLIWHIWFFSFHTPNYMFFFCIQKEKKSKNKNQNKQTDKTKKKIKTHTHKWISFWVDQLLSGMVPAMVSGWYIQGHFIEKNISPRSSQLQTASWLEVEFCVLFSFLVLGCSLV